MTLLAQLFGLVALLFLGVYSEDACPTIYSRSNWGARSSGSKEKIPSFEGKSNRIMVKATQTESCLAKARCMQSVQDFQANEQNMGKSDLDCSFVIGGDGNVYEGRGWDKQTSYGNEYSFCVIGTFNTESPSTYQRSALEKFFSCGVSEGKVDPNYTIETPRDRSGASTNPGETLYILLKAMDRHISKIDN